MTCIICESPKRLKIEAAMARSVRLAVVARWNRLDPGVLEAHLAHGKSDDRGLTPVGALEPAASLLASGTSPVREDPLALLQKAWRLAEDDRRKQAAMIAWLNDQLMADDMGL